MDLTMGSTVNNTFKNNEANKDDDDIDLLGL